MKPLFASSFRACSSGVSGRVVDVDVLVLELVGHAADATRPIDAARIEPDQIERIEAQRARHTLPTEGDVVEARRTGPTWVEQHGADAVALRGDLDQRQIDALTRRIVVVERHLQLCALQRRVLCIGVVARPPVESRFAGGLAAACARVRRTCGLRRFGRAGRRGTDWIGATAVHVVRRCASREHSVIAIALEDEQPASAGHATSDTNGWRFISSTGERRLSRGRE